LLQAQGDYAAARPLYDRALAIREKAFGTEHPQTVQSLNDMGALLCNQGEYAAARPLFERALAIREKLLGPEHFDTARSLANLGALLHAQGEYAAARPLLERVLAIRDKSLGPLHPETAAGLHNLAVLLRALGDEDTARRHLERALAIREKALGPEHPDTALTLSDMAIQLADRGDYAAARPLQERALAIREKSLGPEHIEATKSLNDLAFQLWRQGEYGLVRPLLERVLAVREKRLGPEHPLTAEGLNNLAVVLRDQGDHSTAASYLDRALKIREMALGAEHPDTTTSLRNLGIQLADMGSDSQAWDLAHQAVTSSLALAESTLWTLSENERLLFLGKGEKNISLLLSLATRSKLAVREAAAYGLSLAWRGLVSRMLFESRARLRASLPSGASTAMENLHGVQAELSKLLYAAEIPDPEGREREIQRLRQRRNELEVELQRLAGLSVERGVGLTELCQSLPPGTAFLDMFVHQFYEPAQRQGETVVRKGQWTPDHLSAWIVRPDRELVGLDLGPAEEIERAVKDWLAGVVADRTLVDGRGIAASRDSHSASRDGEKLRSLLWEPIAAKLDGVRRVFVRMDGFLGTLPLEVVPIEGGRYLVEDKSFVYVQSPSDLSAAPPSTGSEYSSFLAVGGVDFRSRAELEADRHGLRSIVASADLRGARQQGWPSLPFTRSEAESIATLYESALGGRPRLLLQESAATEERLKDEVPRHSAVHLATHGFFNPAGTVSMWDSALEAAREDELRGPGGLERETRALVGQLPGLLTGLVCAGASEPAPAGRDDGLLTAEEVLWLDLSKVDLVVLSACETALGERRSGAGMIGLRRAFGLAGAKTVVSSLWSVQDQSTSELMQHFYANLWLKHQGRADALRNAQLEMLAKNRATEHDALPSTWGAFVLSGAWR
jgi:CHAT domain-containing protein/tetratricopeptide (TPR) repeat protein